MAARSRVALQGAEKLAGSRVVAGNREAGREQSGGREQRSTQYLHKERMHDVLSDTSLIQTMCTLL